MLTEFRQRKESYCLILEKAKFDYMDASRIFNALFACYTEMMEIFEAQNQRLEKAMSEHHGRFHMASAINPDAYENSIRYCHSAMHDCQAARENVNNAKKEMDFAKENVLKMYCYIEKLESRVGEIGRDILYLSALQQDRLSGDIFLMTRYGAGNEY